MTILVYTKNRCSACDQTKKFLDDHAIEYVAKNIEDDESALLEAVTYGFRSMPIVVTDNGSWAGLNKDRLLSLL